MVETMEGQFCPDMTANVHYIECRQLFPVDT